MVEVIYNLLKDGKTISCEDISRKTCTSKELVLAALNYLLDMKLIKKEPLNITPSCSSNNCKSCSLCSNNCKPIYVYSLINK